MASGDPRDKSVAEKTAWPLLFITAAYQAYAGLSSVAYVFMGVSNPAGGLGAWTAAAAGGLQAIIAVAAIVLGVRQDLRGTVLAVAGGTLLGWLATLPSVAAQGLDFRDGGERIASAYFVLAPVIAIAAAALAWRRLFPVAAALVVTAPTLVGLLFIAALAAVIAIHGI